ncbi:MAG: preprotein translocase subunit SecY [Patescibacteria group bacterium]
MLKKILKIKDLRKKILLTSGLLVAYRFAAAIPIPGIDMAALQQLFQRNQFLGLLGMLSGGAMQRLSIVSLGLSPYITASIMMQLLTMTFPKLEELSREGEYGREKIARYTKFISVPLSLIQAFGLYTLLRQQQVVGSLPLFSLIYFLLILMGGVFFLVWVGDLITEYGIGNGSSIIISVGILSRLPVSLAQTVSVVNAGTAFSFLWQVVLAIFLVGAIVIVEEGAREIEVRYASRRRGSRASEGGRTYLPLRVNQAGVVPILFAGTLVLLPSMIAGFFGGLNMPVLGAVFSFLDQNLQPGSFLYTFIYFWLVVAFTFFYTAVTFDPEKIAEDMKKYGGFIPGIRPGKATVNYLNWVLTRVTLVGALFLGSLAILPSVMSGVFGGQALSLGGTGILIVVSVILDVLKKVEGRLSMSGYEQFI